jgi:hypothetical protein
MSRKAMQMALEALELLARYENPSTKIQVRKPKEDGSIVTMYPHKVATEAAALLRERLAQPSKPWVGLTADEIWKCNRASGSAVEFHICYEHQNVLDFAESLEAKLKEKNT